MSTTGRAPVRGSQQRARQWRGVIEEYRGWLPVDDGTPAISLGEGGTPLVESGWLSRASGCRVWLKVEGNNPTGSFKDRGMTVAVSLAAEQGAKVCVCASTGNTSASMSAYAVRGGLQPLVLVPQGRVAAGKMAQAVMHGATILQVRGWFDDCLRIARALADDYPVALVNSVNPVRIEGQKTAAFEVVDALGYAPDIHVLPVGNAGNISAYWKGYLDYAKAGVSASTPRMWGYQAAGAAPLVLGHVVASPETAASAIRVGNPASWSLAVAARDESDGLVDAVTDAEIFSAQRALASQDGVFVEPASAAGAAGLLKGVEAGALDPGQTVVVTVTGHGLKDIDTALDQLDDLSETVVAADVTAIAQLAGLA